MKDKQGTISPIERRFLTLDEASAYVGVCSKQIVNWSTGAGLPLIRIGHVVRVDRFDLDRFMVRHRTGDQDTGSTSLSCAGPSDSHGLPAYDEAHHGEHSN